MNKKISLGGAIAFSAIVAAITFIITWIASSNVFDGLKMCIRDSRNTLVYRLEKIKKLTGLDLREFDHAIVFKIALMVKKYLISNPAKL